MKAVSYNKGGQLPEAKRTVVRPRFGIRAQVLTLSIVPLIFLLIALILSAFLQHAADDAEVRNGVSTRVLFKSDEVYRILDLQSRASEQHFHTHRAVDARQFFAQGSRIVPTLDALRALVGAEDGRMSLYAVYRTQTLGLEAVIRRLYAAPNAKAHAAILALPSTTAQLNAWRNAKDGFDGAERTLALTRLDVERHHIEPFRRALLASAAIGVAATILLSLRFGVRLARRLNRLASNARRIAAGREPEPIDGNDEVAELDTAYRQVTASLRTTTAEREQARRIAATLQLALLPQSLPTIPGMQIDSAYVSAGEQELIGGDWYDVFPLSEDLIGISAGDVAGHGLPAATRMNAARQSIRTAARAADDAADVLRHVNRVLCADEFDSFVSAFYATFDRTNGKLSYALAGHPPPIIVHQDGAAEPVAGQGMVLGVDARAHFQTYARTIELGAALVVYSDGLIEHRRDALTGMDALIAAVRAEYLNPSANPADGVQQRILSGETAHDDSAVLFLRFLERSAVSAKVVKEWSFDARHETEATRVKRALLWELAAANTGSWEIGTIEAIYGELSSNVARHTPGPARVVLERADDDMLLRMYDRGGPFEPKPVLGADLFAESGRGMFLIGALGRGMHIDHTDGGNCVTVILPRPEPAERLSFSR